MGAREVTQQLNKRRSRFTIAFLSIVLTVSIGSNIYQNALTHEIRTTQVTNTATTNRVATCELNSFNDILKDARLAFTGDHNPSDYAQAPTKC